MNKCAKVIFTNADKQAEAVGYLQLFITNEITENHEIFYDEAKPFPFMIRLKDKVVSLGEFLANNDKHNIMNSFKSKRWETGTQILKVLLYHWKANISA